MNVASSIAPVIPSALPSSPGAQSALDQGTPCSFANAMLAVQPKDATSNNPAEALLKIVAIAADPPAATINADTKAIAPPTHAKVLGNVKFAPPQPAANLVDASDKALLSGEGQDVLPPLAAPDTPAGSEHLSKPPSVPAQLASGPATSQPIIAVPQGAADIPVTVIDASAVPAPLNDKQPHVKAAPADTSKAAKKDEHTHAASAPNAAAPQVPCSADVQVSMKAGEIKAVASVALLAQPEPAHEQPVPVITSAPAAPQRTFSVSSMLRAMPPTKGSAVPALVDDSAPVTPPVAARPADAPIAVPHGAAAFTADARQASPRDERTEESSSPNVFAGALGTSVPAAEPAALFVPSLITQAAPPGEHRASTDFSSAISVTLADNTPDVAMASAAPVRRLEITVNDPLLGNMDVRAEMRGGALHATLIGTQDTPAASMPALHQFLQQHDVAVHTLTYTNAGAGVAATGSTASSSSDMGRDPADRNFGGGAGSGSQQPQGDGSQPQQGRHGGSDTGYDEHLFVPAYTPRTTGHSTAVASNTLPTGSTLSIHI